MALVFGLVGAVGVVGRFVAAALVEAAYCCITAALPNACKPQNVEKSWEIYQSIHHEHLQNASTKFKTRYSTRRKERFCSRGSATATCDHSRNLPVQAHWAQRTLHTERVEANTKYPKVGTLSPVKINNQTIYIAKTQKRRRFCLPASKFVSAFRKHFTWVVEKG